MGMSYNKQIINICRLAIIFSLTCIGSIIAQELATTKDGKLIVLFKNSTWKYMDMETWLNLKENNEKIIRENEQNIDSILSDIWNASIKYRSDTGEWPLTIGDLEYAGYLFLQREITDSWIFKIDIHNNKINAVNKDTAQKVVQSVEFGE